MSTSICKAMGWGGRAVGLGGHTRDCVCAAGGGVGTLAIRSIRTGWEERTSGAPVRELSWRKETRASWSSKLELQTVPQRAPQQREEALELVRVGARVEGAVREHEQPLRAQPRRRQQLGLHADNHPPGPVQVQRVL